MISPKTLSNMSVQFSDALSSLESICYELFDDSFSGPLSDDVKSDVDNVLTYLYSVPAIKSYLDDLMKYRYRQPNRYFLEALSDLESDFDHKTLLRVIHQQDEDIAFLSRRLDSYVSMLSKHESLVRKVDWLKRQNKRLVSRNKDLVDRVYKSTNNR